MPFHFTAANLHPFYTPRFFHQHYSFIKRYNPIFLWVSIENDKMTLFPLQACPL
jgi:hypothetical protein